MEKVPQKYIEIGLFRALAIIATAILTMGVGAAWGAARGGVLDHFRLNALSSQVDQLTVEAKEQQGALQRLIIVETKVGIIDKKIDDIDRKIDMLVLRTK